MKFYKYISLVFCITILLSGCEKMLLTPNPQTDNTSIFEEYWNVMNEKYAMFKSKGVNWQEVHDAYRPKITNTLSDKELFAILEEMTLKVRDGHTALTAPFDTAAFDIMENHPLDFDSEMLNKSLETTLKYTDNGAIAYGTIRNNLGYIFIPSFDTEISEEEENKIMENLMKTNGIIIDVRVNTGGDPLLAARIASHFSEKEVYAGFERFKTGPGSNDFSDSKISLIPASQNIYKKPVVVLTARLCYSATTTLIYLMNPMKQVTFIGGRTGGGSGSVADGFLANGWKYDLSCSEFIDWEGRHLDDGFDPDIEVHLNTEDKTKDEILERAITELSK